MSEYKFKITSIKAENYLPEAAETICVQVSEAEFNPTSFVFIIDFNQNNRKIQVKDVSVKVGVAWQDMETIAYLKGKFTFTSERSVNQALIELQKGFNKQNYSIDNFKQSWRELHRQFVLWFHEDFNRYLDIFVASHEILCSLNKKADGNN